MENEGIRLHKRKWNWLDRGKKNAKRWWSQTQNELRSHEEPHTIGSIFQIEIVDRYRLGLTKPTKANKTKNKKMDTATEISQCEPFRAWREPGTKWQSVTTWQCLPEREAKTKTPAAVSLTITQSDQTIGNSYWAETNKKANKQRHNLPKSKTKLTWLNKHTDTHIETRIFTRIPQKTKGMIRKQDKPEGEEVNE